MRSSLDFRSDLVSRKGFLIPPVLVVVGDFLAVLVDNFFLGALHKVDLVCLVLVTVRVQMILMS